MDTQTTLRELGLAGNEARVYLALLDLGSSLAGEITKKSGVNRTNVYDALEKLIEKGLASYVISTNRKYFEAAPPTKFISFLDDKKKEIERKKQLVQQLLPELEVRRKLSKEPQEATIYKGKQGLKSIAEDVLNQKQTMFVFGAEGKFSAMFTHYAEQWHMRRGKLKIPLKMIFNEKVRETKTKANFPLAELRFITRDETPATTWIYGNTVAIIVWSIQPLATVIRSKEVADSYKIFFDGMWNNAKE
ncbi:hypothetical protein HZA96_04185 [Candidatus Woesearchaeota archaeon]|nr:hypothetical protein [Candidatus Woesearchaeota archaeon]